MRDDGAPRNISQREGISVKMGNLFWPVLLIIAGGLMLVRTVFNVNLPVGKIILAVALVWGGAILISASATRSSVVFGSRMDLTDNALEYTVMFDSSELDLTHEIIERDHMEIDCVFGKAVVVLPAGRSVHIEATGVLCSLRSPGGRTITFGEGTYDCGEGQPLTVEANCAFGELVFIEPDLEGGDAGGEQE